MGQDALVVVDSDDQGRMIPAALADRLAKALGRPSSACRPAVNTGAFDLFEQLVEIARTHAAWVHVDGAFGLWAAASDATRHLVAGFADADSWATDAHKTLNVPYDCGLAIVRDPTWTAAVFGLQADYLIAASEDPLERTPELSGAPAGSRSGPRCAALGRRASRRWSSGCAPAPAGSLTGWRRTRRRGAQRRRVHPGPRAVR